MHIKMLHSVVHCARNATIRRCYSTLEHSPLGAMPKVIKAKVTSNLIHVAPEVAEAIVANEPVVALESTIITHGMPYPQNLSVAKEVCKVIRENGAIPATVAAIDGRLHVGLTGKELEEIAHPDTSVTKTSRRDLPYILSQGLSGGTTVSATMIAANKAGIKVFVTGGIGGVHREAQTTFDVSADLTELGKTPVAVVCAGAKSILDIGLTLEYLETQGVTVATYGSTNEFPAFFTAKSGYKSSCFINTPIEAAKLIDCSLSLGLDSGLVIAVPIPESQAPLGSFIETAILQALQEASSSNVCGKDVTPFILKRVNEITGGKSLEANISLIKNNAKIGSQISVELSKIQKMSLQQKRTKKSQPTYREQTRNSNKIGTGRPVVVGGSNVDFVATAEQIIPEASNPGKIQMSFGGVGRNIAEALGRLGDKPIFISAVGGDPLGAMLLKHCQESNMSTGGIHTFGACQTATYSAVLNNAGDFNVAVGDMDIHLKISPQIISGFEESIQNAPIVVVDCNISEETMDKVVSLASLHSVPVWFEPTCLMKAGKPFQSDTWKNITYASPNFNELRAMSDMVVQRHNLPRHPRVNKWKPRDQSLDDIIEECVLFSQPLLTHIHCLVVTLGKHGVLICRNTKFDHPFPTSRDPKLPRKHNHLVSAVHYPVPDVDDVINVTGAGDSLAAAMVMSITKDYAPDLCVKFGLMAALQSLRSRDTIASSMTSISVESIEDFYGSLCPREIDILSFS